MADLESTTEKKLRDMEKELKELKKGLRMSRMGTALLMRDNEQLRWDLKRAPHALGCPANENTDACECWKAYLNDEQAGEELEE